MGIQYKHARHHVINEYGEDVVSFFQNTVRDILMGNGSDGSKETIRGHILYRTDDCTTEASTVEKKVTCKHFNLKKGVTVAVKFTKTNTASNPTLNVNETGAKLIKKNGSNIDADGIEADNVYMFNYNGSSWDLVGSAGSVIKIEKYVDSTTSKKYLTGVSSDGKAKNLEINDNVYTIGNKLYGYGGGLTVDIKSEGVVDTDYRSNWSKTTGENISTIISRIKNIFNGLGALAFKSVVSKNELNNDLISYIDQLHPQSVTTTDENLDTYRTPGIYYFSLNYKPLNTSCPESTSRNGHLIVVGSLKQLWIDYDDDSNGYIWMRTYLTISNKWSTWKSTASKDELDDYLTKTSASSTYLSKTDASSTYLSKTDASNSTNGYATKAELKSHTDTAATTYALKTSVGDKLTCSLSGTTLTITKG